VSQERPDVCEVVITAPDAAWLLDFTRDLIADRLAASAHNLAEVRSLYRWEGKVNERREARAMIRTRASLVPAIVARTVERHPYQVPSVVALPIVAANPDYVAWIIAATRTADDAD
jgi:periplasmic divalent cation tolerance protein